MHMAIVTPCHVSQENFIIASSLRLLQHLLKLKVTGAKFSLARTTVVVVQNLIFVMSAYAHAPKTKVALHEKNLWCAALALMGIVGMALTAHHAHQVPFQPFRYQESVSSPLNVCLA